MADVLKHDADLFEKAALKTGDVRDRVSAVLTTLESTLAGRGAPWGEDKMGHQFSEGPDGYKSAREKMFTNIKNAVTSFGNFSSGQTQTADLLRAMDVRNGDSFK
jgi:hypothetical protein